MLRHDCTRAWQNAHENYVSVLKLSFSFLAVDHVGDDDDDLTTSTDQASRTFGALTPTDLDVVDLSGRKAYSKFHSVGPSS